VPVLLRVAPDGLDGIGFTNKLAGSILWMVEVPEVVEVLGIAAELEVGVEFTIP
jgi:hypothetical protein